MSVVKPISSFKLTTLLRHEHNPLTAINLFKNPNPESTKPFKYSLLNYDLIITKLGTSKMYTELDQILLQLKNDTRIIPTEIILCNVITYYARGKLLNRALHVFDEMPVYRCKRTVKSFNSLLNVILKCGEFGNMREVVLGFDKADACSYNVLINGYMQNGFFKEGLRLFDVMVKKKVKPSGVTFGILVNGLCKNGGVKEALKMKLDMLKVYGVYPTVYVYASLIKAVCGIGEVSLGFRLKDEAWEGKVRVDAAIYNTLISAVVKDGRSSEVVGILEEMSEKGCKPDTVTYNVLINGYCVADDFVSAYRVLDEIVEKKLKPDVIGYNMILGALFRVGKWEEGIYLFEDMPRRGCSPDVLSYRIVFDGLCESLHFEEGTVILDEMLFKGYKPRRDKLEWFLQRLSESGKFELLGKVVSSLHRENAIDADLWSVIVASTICKEPVITDSIDSLLNTLKEDGPLSSMPQC